MSYKQADSDHVESTDEESTTDAVAAVALILIAVATAIYWVAGQ